MNIIGTLVHTERKRRGLTLRQLGEAAGFSAAYINDIEHGNRKPTSDTFLSSIAAPLGIDPDIVWYCAGRIPPDLRGLDVTPEQVHEAFAAFRAAIAESD